MIWRKSLVNAAATLLASLFAAAAPAAAQGRITYIDDAAPVPRGMVRLRVAPSFARYDSRFAVSSIERSSTVPLAAALAADSLGVAQVPGLAPSEEALRTLTGDAGFRLSLGRSTSVATARVVTTPIILEYGLTRRLTVGGVFPLVQSRSELFVTLNQEDAANANVGPNPARPAGSLAQMQAINLQSQLTAVRTQLASRLAGCDANPASHPSCPTILANRADVVSLVAETSAFSSAVGVIFGTTTDDAQPFAPLAETTTAAAIGTQLNTLTNRLRGYVGSPADQIVATVPLAAGPAGFENIQDLLLNGEFGLSPDSLGQTYRLNFGDIELGAKLLVLERGAWTPGVASPWLRTRLAVTGLVRLGTGAPALERMPYRYLETGTGDGQTDIEGGALLDLGLGPRVTLMTAARYTMQLGSVNGGGRIPDENGIVHPFTPLHEGTRRLGDVFVAEVTPRVALGRFLGVDAHYAFISRADDEYSPSTAGEAPLMRGGFTEQRLGLGISYSTLRGTRGREPRLPVEVSVAHIETIAGSNGMVPRAGRDQIELRLYYRVRR